MTNSFWDERYAEPELAYGDAPNDFLREVASRIPAGGTVLCLAEGQGRNAVYLAEQGFEVTAVDASKVGMERAQKLAQERGVKITTIAADLAEYPIDAGMWDGIVSIFGHLPPPLRARVHRDAVAGLRPGGVLILEAYTPRQLEFKTGGPPVTDLLMTLDVLRGELEGMQLEIARELDRDVHEGKYHAGRAAVVQILGVK